MGDLDSDLKSQRRSYGEPNRIVQFHRGEWVWRAYPLQGGKLRYTNRGPWLVLAKTGPVTYKIQRHPQAEPDIVHVDKLMPYYPDFGEKLHSWIETDHPTQYRDQGEQTASPTLQSQLTAVHPTKSARCQPLSRTRGATSRSTKPILCLRPTPPNR